MERDIRLRLMCCPGCGSALKIADETKKLLCPSCENFILPVPIGTVEKQPNDNPAENIRTVSAALAFARIYYDLFDWDSFAYLQSCRLPVTRMLAEKFTRLSADDVRAWILAFDSMYVPVRKKIEVLARSASAIATAYREDKTETASQLFDSFRQQIAFLQKSKDSVLNYLTQCTENAKYSNALPEETEVLQAKTEEMRHIFSTALHCPSTLENLPGIRNIIDERGREVEKKFADAEARYRRAGTCLTEKKYTEALDTLHTVFGYKNAKPLYKEINRCYRFRDTVQLTGRLFLLRDSDKGQSLFSVDNGIPSDIPIIKGITQWLGNYADTVYFKDTKDRVLSCSLSDGQTRVIETGLTAIRQIAVETESGNPCFVGVTSAKSPHSLVMLDVKTGTTRSFAQDIGDSVLLQDGKAVGLDTAGDSFVLDLQTGKKFRICHGPVKVCGFTEDGIVYTRQAPVPENKNLYLHALAENAQEILIEANIYDFYRIIDGKPYYTVGNEGQRSLLCIEPRNRRREQIVPFVREICEEYAGKLYILQGDEYNTALYAVRCDGKSKQLICRNLRAVKKIAYGRLFYTDMDGNLCSVRLDGTDEITLFADMEDVISVRDGRIFFTAADKTVVQKEIAGNLTVRKILSLYCMNPDGTEKQKIAYNIANACSFDETSIDFYKVSTVRDGSPNTFLFRLDIRTMETYRLLGYAEGGKKLR